MAQLSGNVVNFISGRPRGRGVDLETRDFTNATNI